MEVDMRYRTYLAIVLVVALLLAAIPTGTVQAASLVEITNFGTNPTGLRMYLYVPNNVAAQPAILLALHYCTGTGPAFYSGTEFASLADRYGFIVIYPSATRSGQCWDVSSPGAFQHNGNSDPVGLISMITYVEQHNNGDSNRVYVTGASSGAMMTNVMLGDYPDVFKAGAAFMGVPFSCFAASAGDPTNPANPAGWNSQCANGQISRTPQQWGDLVRGAFPGYTGARPRMQVWHGTADTTLNYNNFGEEIKQWTNVLGVSQTPSFTDQPQSGWTRTRYGATGVGGPVEAISISGVGHSLPLSGQAAMAIQFMGLDNNPPPTTPPPTTPPPTTPPPTTPPPGTNLLTNAGFESGTTNWTVNGSGSLAADTSVVHGGTRSLLITGRTAAWNGPRQTVTSQLVSGATYSTNVWMRLQSGTATGKVTVAVTANGSTSYIGLAQGAVNSTGWTLLSGSAAISWSGTLSSAFFYAETTSGTASFYIDDAFFSSGNVTPPPTTPPPTTPPPTTPPPTTPPPTTPPPTTPPPTTAISVPFTKDGAGTFCWQTSNPGSYINSWNMQSLTVNGVDFTNKWASSGSYPAKINGYWYVSYTGNFAWSHFEAK